MSSKEDLRVQRTRRLLSDTLLDMMEKQSIEQISVIDLCNGALVNRATFYKHFYDKYALLGYTLNEIKRDLYADLTVEDSSADTPQESLRLLFASTLNFFFNHRSRIANVICYNPHGKVVSAVEECIYAAILFHMNAYLDKYAVKIPIELLARYVAGGIVATILWCVNNPDKFTYEEFDTYLQLDFFDSVFEKI